MKKKRNTASQTIRECDVFISYRRDGGDMTAMYFYQALKERGYNVFYDLEVLRSGRFNEALLSSIESCKDFVLILSPGALDRCDDENDWVRKEIAEALRTKKNIIPVMLKGFVFPDNLPEEIDDVRYRNGLTCTTEYFEESINRLCQRYLISLPTPQKRIGKPSAATFVIAAVAVLALGVGGFLGMRGIRKPATQLPAPTAEVAQASAEAPIEAPAAEAVAEPTVEPTLIPTAEPAGQAIRQSDFPALSEAIDRCDGNQNLYDEREKSIRQNSPVLNHPTLKRRDVASVTFLPSLEGAPADAWDVSQEGDGRVLAWATPSGELFDLFIAGDGGVKILEPERIPSTLFADYVNATAIRFNGCVDLSMRVSLNNAFQGCASLKEIDFTGVCFDNAWDMGNMFAGCEALKTLDTTGWHATRLGNMENIFCDSGLEALNLSGLDTSSVISMEGAFRNCAYLTQLDLGALDTHMVSTMAGMFEGCVRFEALDLSGLNTGRILSTADMFKDCWGLKSIRFDGFDTSRVTDMSRMFMNCTDLESLDLSGFDTARAENMSRMFYGCIALSSLDTTGWDTSRVQYMTSMFEGCVALYKLDLTHFNTSAVTSMQHMFSSCDYAVELLVTGWDVSNIKQMDGMFQGCAALESIGRDPAAFGHGDTTGMYDGCIRLAGLDAAQTGASAGLVRNTGFPVLTRAVDALSGDDAAAGEDGAQQIREDSPVLNHPSLRRKDIASITFLPSLEGAPSDAWDVSEAGDGQVMAWTTPNDGLFDLTIAGNGGVKILDPKGDARMFTGYSNVESIHFNGCVDLSERSDFFRMFSSCHKLKQIDLSGVCTENAAIMAGMFEGCWALESLDLSGFDTSKVINMAAMFLDCAALQELDVTGFSTDRVLDMQAMFSGCTGLKALDVSRFNTGMVEDMSAMFKNCSSLGALDVSDFDTGRVINMGSMFYHCSAIEALDVSGFDTGRVTLMGNMFDACAGLTSLDVTGFDTSRVTDMQEMFHQCSSLTALDVSRFDTGRVTTMRGMFNGCMALQALDVGGFNTSKVQDLSVMFADCATLRTLDLTGWDTSSAEDMRGMFWSCIDIDKLDLSGWNTAKVRDMRYMFADCMALYQLDLSDWDTRSVETMSSMFQNDSYAVALLVTHWDVSSVRQMNNMFSGCTVLESIGRDPATFGHGDTAGMYDDCGMLAAG